MKKVIISGAILLVILVLATGYMFYRRNLTGAWVAFQAPKINIAEKIEKASINKTDFPLTLPAGYELSIYASGMSRPRVLALDPQGTILVSDIVAGNVYAFGDSGEKSTVASALTQPHGLALDCKPEQTCYLYIAETNKVSRFGYDANKKLATNKEILFDLPGGGRHFSRTILIKGDKLYTSIGSSCDTCNEQDKRRAAVYVSNLDGSDFKLYSSGLRNAVFMREHPGTKEIWVTEMGRDFLGDNLPPDEINVLSENGFFGWPYCYGNRVQDTTFDASSRAAAICADSIPSKIDLQAHSAPLGLDFLNQNHLLVAYHGSWNRSEPTGYKIVKINLSTKKIEDFITGWLDEGASSGRPVDILVSGENIFISDDKAGVVYLLKKI